MSLYSRLDRIAADVQRLDRQLNSVSNSPQAQRTSVEGGSIDFNDSDGNLKAIVGEQDDGGNTINVLSGPTPPTPAGFTVEVDHGKFIVHWSGDFDGDKLAPSDWSRAEVHASQDPFFVPSRATARGSIVSAAGGEVTIGVLKGPWTIKMLAWSQAGKMSAPSAPVDVEVPGYGDIVLEEIDAAQTRIDNARAILVDGQETLGTKLDEADTALASLRDSLDNLDETTLPALRQDLDAAEGRLSDAEGQITDAFGQLDAVPGQISDARQAAIDAAQADAEAKASAAERAAKAHADLVAEGAESDAVAAAETRAQELADAAQSAAEQAAQVKADAARDQAISDATGKIATARQEAIDAAQAELDQVEGTLTSMIGGKSATKWSTSNPPAQYSGAVGDTWVKLTSLGSGGREIKRSRWQGDVWVDHPVDGAVLSNVDASTITTGFLDVANRVRAGAVTADKVMIGTERNMVPNGDLSKGSALGWPNTLTYTTSAPDGLTGSVATPAGTSTHKLGVLGDFTVVPGDVLVFEVWVKADKPNSSMYIEVRDQAGSILPDADHRWEAVEGTGPARSYLYPVANYSVPTVWTKLVSRVIIRPGVSKVRLDNFYANHVAGTERTAVQSVTGLKLYKAVGGTLIEPGGIQTPHLAADVLEVGNLKAGAGEIAEVVSQKIAAAVGRFLELDVGQLTVTGASKLAAVVAEQIAADVGEYVKLSVGQLVAGEGVMDEATVQKLFTDVVVAGISQAQEFIGENAILTGAVTAPKITASEELWAKIAEFVNVRAEMIDSDAFNGRVFTGNTYLTSDGNGEFADRGLFFQKPDGTSIMRIPTDGTPMSMSASDTQIERAQVSDLDVSAGAVRSGGTFSLSAGVTQPASPPELTAAWRRSVTLDKPSSDMSYNWTGLDWWANGNRWVRAVNVLGSEGDPYDRVELYDPDTGQLDRSFHIESNPRAGVAVIGDIVYSLGPDQDPATLGQQMRGFDLMTERMVSSWDFARFESPQQAKLALGTDGTHLLVAGISLAATNLYTMTYDPSTGAQIGADLLTEWPTSSTKSLEGVSRVGNMLYVSTHEYARSYEISGSTLTRVEGLGWTQPSRDGSGVTIVDGRPCVVTSSGALYVGSAFESDTTMQACFTWFDGVHETPPSPVATVPVPARNSVTMSLPARAGLQKRVYFSPTGGSWSRETLAEDVTAFVKDASEVGLHQPPTANSFPTATPAVLKSGNGDFELKGDGSGRWGPLRFFANGTWSGAVVSGQNVITPSGTNQVTSVEITFPPGRFTTIPEVTLTAYTNAPQNVSVSVRDVSATSFTINMFSPEAGARRIAWIAFDQGA